MSRINDWLGGAAAPEPEPERDALEDALFEVPTPSLADPAEPGEVLHVSQERAQELVALLDTYRGRLQYAAEVKALKRAGYCPGCVQGLAGLLTKERSAWGQS